MNQNVHPIHASAQKPQQPIRGIYVSAPSTKGLKFTKLLSLVKNTELNAMVIDIKDDHGNLTFIPPKGSPYYSVSRPYIQNPKALIQTLESTNIYPIARIVVFKDSVLSASKPNWSFRTARGIWRNGHGDAFTNPFLKEVWDYNIGMAILAANMGFKEIQFDYVRFPEKFEAIQGQLTYERRFQSTTNRPTRVTAITEFVKYAREKLRPYNVKISVDVFGNATVIPEAPGIGQNFSSIAQNVDIISAMIYPSHWTSMFGIRKPDLEPFRLVQEYAKVENKRLNKLSNPPISRPWLQDFTAAWLGRGNYKVYGKQEIEEQIRALHSQGIDEFLLWSGINRYTPNVDYTPY
ncbi:putative glycoside hydrolase [Neobacillus sp. PS3-40]|uniref:putative glycoside hydrolase n=1 Tax=Neobacillus sp. PS3-40 TaxID=3070679 RepID=UPI0027DFE815|nr:putative glycoside hydrolase [Neobacillus sp. PS3-40]WML46474.1 putative glycoside hydrolase [Neobacillus sp. PS3-40]